MNPNLSRVERWFVVALALLGVADILLTVVTGQQYIGTVVTNLLVLGLLALVVEIFAHYGTESRWVFAAGSLLLVGAISDALVTLIGLPNIPEAVPKLLWGLGLILVLYEVFSTGRNQQSVAPS